MAYISSNQRKYIPIVMLLKRLKMKGVWKGTISQEASMLLASELYRETYI